jgi:hypothetical protein
LPDSQHWLEEGTASYVEPIARVQAEELTPQHIWGDMMAAMAHGEPESGDLGLGSNSHLRSYLLGGALRSVIHFLSKKACIFCPPYRSHVWNK